MLRGPMIGVSERREVPATSGVAGDLSSPKSLFAQLDPDRRYDGTVLAGVSGVEALWPKERPAIIGKAAATDVFLNLSRDDVNLLVISDGDGLIVVSGGAPLLRCFAKPCYPFASLSCTLSLMELPGGLPWKACIIWWDTVVLGIYSLPGEKRCSCVSGPYLSSSSYGSDLLHSEWWALPSLGSKPVGGGSLHGSLEFGCSRWMGQTEHGFGPLTFWWCGPFYRMRFLDDGWGPRDSFRLLGLPVAGIWLLSSGILAVLLTVRGPVERLCSSKLAGAQICKGGPRSSGEPHREGLQGAQTCLMSLCSGSWFLFFLDSSSVPYPLEKGVGRFEPDWVECNETRVRGDVSSWVGDVVTIGEQPLGRVRRGMEQFNGVVGLAGVVMLSGASAATPDTLCIPLETGGDGEALEGLDLIEGGVGSGGSAMLVAGSKTMDDGGPTPMHIGEIPTMCAEVKGTIRSSERLLSAAKVPILERAKRRKATLREGDASSSGILARKWSRKKVAEKSARCGVRLTEREAKELHKFLLMG